MASDSTSLAGSVRHELVALREQWWCFLLLGISLVVLGTVAICYPILFSVAATTVIGFLLLAGGIMQIVSSFWSGRWSGMLFHLLIGLLYTIAGWMIVDAPVENTILLTRILALFLIIAGVFRIVVSLFERFADWGWVLLNGGITLLLGLLIYRQGNEAGAGLWIIGLVIGIEMILNGWAWIMLSLGLRRAKI